MEKSQSIRSTQFITTYGPGAILEGLNGPRLIKSIGKSGIFATESPERYEIYESALSNLLQDQGRIFRLPSNAERGVKETQSLYDTEPFPRWSLCVHHNLLYRAKPTSRHACPQCPSHKDSYRAWETARQEAVSFVMVCPDGHLDDVPWSFLIHRNSNKDCAGDELIWKGAGGPLRSVRLECPRCGAWARMEDLYHRDHSCLGVHREKSLEQQSCTRKARISQRSASDIFIPEVYSALTLPRVDNAVYRAMQHSSLKALLLDDPPDEAKWQRLFGILPGPVVEVLQGCDLSYRNEMFRRVAAEELPTDANGMRLREFESLMESARGESEASEHFLMEPHNAQVVDLAPYRLRVVPVSRLRVVMAQVGYTRLSGNLVDCDFQHGSSRWYPGVELFGEGIFLHLETPLQLRGQAAADWGAIYADKGEASQAPGFVWWHTLSHRLIRALGIHSGYSAASVRERVYFSPKAGGGVLIYAVQPGGDGTLGGLVALVPRFGEILRQALSHLDGCSNDPLCGDHRMNENHVNGAACYACCLLSETSCDHRNRGLDRQVLLQSLGRCV